MRRPLIAGNWKMNGMLADARALVTGIRAGLSDEPNGPEVVVCPPSHLLFPMAKAVAGCEIQLGAQNVHEEEKGAFTGEVSVGMLAETECRYIIVGHSERRQYFGETAPLLSKKVRAVVGGGLGCIYCVGETLSQREAGKMESVVVGQLRDVLDRSIPAERLVVAYEPVWAIGTGKTATPEQAQEVHALIRGEIGAIFDGESAEEMRILYGGSVKPGNANDLLSQSDIDGALVGGASLVAGDFLAIIDAAGVRVP